MINYVEPQSQLQKTDAECAATAVAPRISLSDIEANIAAQIYLTGFDAAKAAVRKSMLGTEVDYDHAARRAVGTAIDHLTICILILKNGYSIIGKSEPAAPENFDANLGRKLAYEDAVRQVWPLMGYELRSKLQS
jgi:hypothetical protein